MRIITRILITLSVCFNIAFLFYGFHFVWPTKYRAEINHDIDLPETTAIRDCEGSVFNINGHTTTRMQIHPIQLNKFLSQFTVLTETVDSIDNEIERTINCKPSIGDNLIIRYRTNPGYCNITIDTDWN